MNSEEPSSAPTTPGSPEIDEQEDKLARIKYLVDQSKLYADFLIKSIQTPSEETKQIEDDCKLAVALHPHQNVAVQWMLNLFQNGLNGILADEMGLGKTLETIAFLAYLKSQGIDGPFVIVAPLSTIGNWAREIENFAPHLELFQYYGTASKRKTLRKKLATSKIVITTYEIILADAKYLNKISWKYVIVDEGHRLKNVNCKLMKELKKFHSANRMLLTGTPLQNNLTELWALLNFLMPDVFTDIDIFHTWFEEGNTIDEKSEGTLVSSLHSILRPFVLRRLKSEVNLSLPNKREYVVYCGLEPAQTELYEHILKGDAKEYVKSLVEHKNKRRKISKDQRNEVNANIKQIDYTMRHKSFNNMLMQLRQTCNSPLLFYSPWMSFDQVDSTVETTSGKLMLLWEFVKRLEGHKILIFSQFTSMLDVIEDWANFRELSYCRIDGSTARDDREEMMSEFTNNPDVRLFLLSTRSGGQGINLMAADTVVIFDSDWNPHQDLQAMDRVHRIGQDKPVLVLRLIAGDTIEQTLLEKAQSKLEFGHIVIEQAKLKGIGLSQDQQIEQMELQLKNHKVKYSKEATFSDADFEKMLDRSDAAYKDGKVDNPNIWLVEQ